VEQKSVSQRLVETTLQDQSDVSAHQFWNWVAILSVYLGVFIALAILLAAAVYLLIVPVRLYQALAGGR